MGQKLVPVIWNSGESTVEGVWVSMEIWSGHSEIISYIMGVCS